MSIEVMRKLADAYKQVNESKFIIPEDIPVDERDMFMAKAAAAHKAGKSHFTMPNGKKHPVTMKKDTAKAVNSSANEAKDDDVKENQKAALAKKKRFNILRIYRRYNNIKDCNKITKDMRYIDKKYNLNNFSNFAIVFLISLIVVYFILIVSVGSLSI